MLILIAAIPLAIWLYLAVFRGGFWRISNFVKSKPLAPLAARQVVAIIPARNEAANIGETIGSLLAQEFPSAIPIVVVDDGSTDGTAEAARAAAHRCDRTAQLKIVPGAPLPPGWTGKLWALAQGVAEAETLAPDYFLFTDADIHHAPHSVASLVAIAESGGYDLASHMVRLVCSTTAERALIPAFVFFFLQLYPPAWIRSSKSKTAAAAGGCVLIRPGALRRIGGIYSIRGEVIDDCALARAVQSSGGRVWMDLAGETRSVRGYGTFAEIGRMISRSAFSQLRHSGWLLALTALALFCTYVLPPILLFTGRLTPALLGAAAWVLMMTCYWPMLRFYRRSPFWCLALPLIALFYLGATVHSAIQYWRRRGGKWKGRVQDLRGSNS